MENQRSRDSLAAYNFDREVCRDTTESLFQYVRFKLEQNQTWLFNPAATPEPPLSEDGKPLFSIESIEHLDNTEHNGQIEISGVFSQPSSVPFKLVIDNNLHNSIGEYGLPPHSARITIETRHGRSSDRKAWILIHQAFSHSTVAASGDIELQTPEVTFATLDPSRNQIRSLANVFLPPADFVEFEPSNNWKRGEKGTVWAYEDIRFGDGTTNLDEASLTTGAQMVPNGKTAYKVPVIPVSKIGANPSKEKILEIEGGRYAFGRTTIEVDDIAGTTHEINLVIIQVQGNGHDDLYLLRSDLVVPPTGEEDSGEEPEEVELDLDTVRLKGSQPPARLFVEDSPEIEVGGGMLVNLEPEDEDGNTLPCHITLPTKTKVVSSGNLEIVGYDSTFLPTLEFTSSHPSTSLEGSERGHLECKKGGSLTLACNIENGGLLMAEGNVSIFPEILDLEASPSEDLAICAGGDVKVNPYLVWSPPTFFSTSGKLGIKGLLYAGNDFEFRAKSNSTGGGEPREFNRELEIEGSVVARGGKVLIVGSKRLTLKYNPDFLDDVLESTTQYQGRQLEIASMRHLGP